MRRRNLLLMIALVAAPSVAGGLARGAQPAPNFTLPRDIAAPIEVVVRNSAEISERVSVAERCKLPVGAVRGDKLSSWAIAAHDPHPIVACSDKPKKPVSGGPVVATVAIVLPAASVRPPIRAVVQVVSFGIRAGRPAPVPGRAPVAWIGLDLPFIAKNAYFGLFAAARAADLDRVAFAVDGAESNHAGDPGMWRPEFDGPQGPMQVSAAAAVDSGGGDRFDLSQNRQLGRAYLALLFRRYGNWPDAVAAYNWGPGNLDAWIAQGRPAIGLPLEVERFRERVLRDGGILQGSAGPLSIAGWRLQAP